MNDKDRLMAVKKLLDVAGEILASDISQNSNPEFNKQLENAQVKTGYAILATGKMIGLLKG